MSDPMKEIERLSHRVKTLEDEKKQDAQNRQQFRYEKQVLQNQKRDLKCVSEDIAAQRIALDERKKIRKMAESTSTYLSAAELNDAEKQAEINERKIVRDQDRENHGKRYHEYRNAILQKYRVYDEHKMDKRDQRMKNQTTKELIHHVRRMLTRYYEIDLSGHQIMGVVTGRQKVRYPPGCPLHTEDWWNGTFEGDFQEGEIETDIFGRGFKGALSWRSFYTILKRHPNMEPGPMGKANGLKDENEELKKTVSTLETQNYKLTMKMIKIEQEAKSSIETLAGYCFH